MNQTQGQLNQQYVSVPVTALTEQVDPELFLDGFRCACAAMSNRSPLGEFEGISIPDEAPDSPINRGLFALQEVLQTCGVQAPAALAPYVSRFLAMVDAARNGVFCAIEFSPFVDTDHNGRPVGFAAPLVLAAAKTKLIALNHGYHHDFDFEELLVEAAAWQREVGSVQ